ncbi:MAG TPA: DUF4160 domain-containing protein [Candidatus Polarisedimenticolaceae bacterium]
MDHLPLRFVTGFEQVGTYVLRVAFDDGTEQTIDFQPVLRGRVFGALRDPEMSRRVRIDPAFRTLVWPNDADFRAVGPRLPIAPSRASSKAGPLPEICRFYGIVIKMSFEKGAPHQGAHFHAEYGGESAVFDAATGKILNGSLAKPQRRLVKAWIELHRHELEANGERAVNFERLERIAPLQ